MRFAHNKRNPQIAFVRNVAVQITLYCAIALSGNGVWIREYDVSVLEIQENGFWVGITPWKVSRKTGKRWYASEHYWECIVFEERRRMFLRLFEFEKWMWFYIFFCIFKFFMFFFADTWKMYTSWSRVNALELA